MRAQQHVLPVKESAKEEDVLHPKYLVSLSSESVNFDKPHYRGDAYEDKPSEVAKRWRRET